MRAIGIDFGMKSTRAAVVERGDPLLLEIPGSGRELPSVVAYSGRAPVFGAQATSRAITHADSTVQAIKSVLGRPRTHPAVAAFVSRSAFPIEGAGPRVVLSVGGAMRPPEAIVASIFDHLLGLATERIGERPSKAVIAAPLWFGDEERRALLDAAARASIESAELISDTAAIAATALPLAGAKHMIGVIDTGAGGTSAAIYSIAGESAQLLGAAADDAGGDLADEPVMKVIVDELSKSGAVERNPATMEMLRRNLESMKRALSVGEKASIPMEIDRARYESLIAPVLDRIEKCCRRALDAARLEPGSLDSLILTGGMSNVAAVRACVTRAWGSPAAMSVAQSGLVAIGAAKIAAAKTSERAPLEIRDTVAPSSPQQPQPKLPPNIPLPPVDLRAAATTDDIGHVNVTTADLGFSARSGRIQNPGTARALLDMAVTRKVMPRDLEPIALPVLLFTILARQKRSGILTLVSGDRKVIVPIHRGAAMLKKAEHAPLVGAFKWPAGTYTFESDAPAIDQTGRTKQSMIRLTIEGLRLMTRGFSEDELKEALEKKLDVAPIVPAELVGDLDRMGLLPAEVRLAKHNFDGKTTVRTMLGQAGAGRHTTLQLVASLMLFDYLDWHAVAGAKSFSAADELAARAKQMETAANHFEVLGIHWSATTTDVTVAHRKMLAEHSPGTPAHKINAEACERIRRCADAAFAVLADERQRHFYRRDTFPDVDFSAVSDILSGTIDSLEMRGDSRGVRNTMSTKQELERTNLHRTETPVPGRTPISRTQTPMPRAQTPVPGRPPPPSKKA